MAIQKSINLTQYGLELATAYHKIDEIRILNKDVSFMIKIYADKAAREVNAQPLNNVHSNIGFDELMTNFQGDDLIAKLYNFVKQTNPNYQADTTDV